MLQLKFSPSRAGMGFISSVSPSILNHVDLCKPRGPPPSDTW